MNTMEIKSKCKYKYYTLNKEFIVETEEFFDNFTGIRVNHVGYKIWCLDGKHHRLDGPAHESAWCSKWCINDKEVTEEQHKLYVDLLKLKNINTNSLDK